MNDLIELIRDTRTAASRTGDCAHDREDLVQETLVRIWERLAGESGSAPAAGFIETTLRRIRIDWWRRRRSRRETEIENGAETADTRTPIDDASWNELRARIAAAIELLPEAQREVVRARYYEGRTFKEIAAAQGVSLNTALGRMHLAMKKLRTTLETDSDH